MSAQVGALVKGLTVTSIRNKGVDRRGIGLRMLGRRHLKELYGYLFPQGPKPNMMASYNTLAMRMEAEKNEAAVAAVLRIDWNRRNNSARTNQTDAHARHLATVRAIPQLAE